MSAVGRLPAPSQDVAFVFFGAGKATGQSTTPWMGINPMGANRRRIIADGKGDGSCKLWVPDSFDAKAYVKPIHADKLNIFVAHIFAGHLRGQEY